MRRFAPNIPMLLAALLALPGARGQDDATRELRVEGLSFTLPKEWEWQGRYAKNVAIKMPLQIGERSDEATAQLFFFERKFIHDTLKEIRAEAEAPGSDKKDFKVRFNQTFAGNKGAVLISYAKERGEGRLYDVRRWLFRRYGHLYEWIEEAPREASGKVAGPFGAAQRALKFGKPENPVVEEASRDFVNQRVRFDLPRDWNWGQGRSGSRIELEDATDKSALLFEVRTDFTHKEQGWALLANLQALKSAGTIDQIVTQNRDHFRGSYTDVEDFTVDEDAVLAGEKGTRLSLTGVIKEAGFTKERVAASRWFIKHKGRIFIWVEGGPAAARKETEKLFQVARKGIKLY